MPTTSRFVAPFLAICFSAFSCPAAIAQLVWLEQSHVFDMPAAGITRMTAETPIGSIEVSAADADYKGIRIEVLMQAGAPTEEQARACLLSMRVDAKEHGRNISLDWDWKTYKGIDWAYQVDYKIIVPADLSMKIQTRKGVIDVQGVKGDLHLKVILGDILVTDGAGDLYAKTYEGVVDLQTDASDVNVKNHRGPILARLTSSGQIEGTIKAYNDAITVELNASASAFLKVKAHDGSIRNELPLTNVLSDVEPRQEVLKGVLGNGGKTLDIKTHTGDITLQHTNTESSEPPAEDEPISTAAIPTN